MKTAVPLDLWALFSVEVRELILSIEFAIGAKSLPPRDELAVQLTTALGNAQSLDLPYLSSVIETGSRELQRSYNAETAARLLKRLESALSIETASQGFSTWQNPNNQAEVFLHPGSVFVSASRKVLKTVLGSCVSVALFDSALGIGGMNHYLLPSSPAHTGSTKYGTEALTHLHKEVCRAGAKELSASVFGGASILEAFRGKLKGPGASNLQRAFTYLAKEKIPVQVNDTGGHEARRIRYEIYSSRFQVERI